jgi:hypothetical protein
MSRIARTRRRGGVRVMLTERDEGVLAALARFRVARTSQLCAYAFDSVRRDTAAVRLRRLFDTRHLAVVRSGPWGENVYRLGPLGKRYLQERGVVVGHVPRGGLEHHLAVVESWVRLATECRLERCLSDWELRQEMHVGDSVVLPDLFALVRVPAGVAAIAVEVDAGTESVGILRSKAERYAALWGRSPGLLGWERFGLVVVLHMPQRRAALASALKNVWVIPQAILTATDPLSSALQPLLQQLAAPLDASAYREGGDKGVPDEQAEEGSR